MKVFEIKFNPPSSQLQPLPAFIFDCFTFQGRTMAQRQLGHLFLIGQLNNVLSNKSTHYFLKELAELISKAYYKNYQKSNEEALKLALEEANHFLSQADLNELELALACLSPAHFLRLSKLGSLKVLLFSQQNGFSVAEENNSEQAFNQIIEGEVKAKDKILLLSKELFEQFEQRNIFEKIINFRNPKGAKQFFKENRNYLQDLSGALLIVFVGRKKRFSFLAAPLFRTWQKHPFLYRGLFYFLFLVLLFFLYFLIF